MRKRPRKQHTDSLPTPASQRRRVSYGSKKAVSTATSKHHSGRLTLDEDGVLLRLPEGLSREDKHWIDALIGKCKHTSVQTQTGLNAGVTVGDRARVAIQQRFTGITVTIIPRATPYQVSVSTATDDKKQSSSKTPTYAIHQRVQAMQQEGLDADTREQRLNTQLQLDTPGQSSPGGSVRICALSSTGRTGGGVVTTRASAPSHPVRGGATHVSGLAAVGVAPALRVAAAAGSTRLPTASTGYCGAARWPQPLANGSHPDPSRHGSRCLR